MNSIEALVNINYSVLFVQIFAVLLGVKAVVSLFEWILDKTGLQTKGMRKRREEHDLLIQTSQNLASLQKKHEEDVDRLDIHEQKINEKLELLTDIITEKQIDDMRYEILDFASALSAKRRFSKDQFDHILEIHKKYEKILEKNHLKNGQVTLSMEVINEFYKERLKNGFYEDGKKIPN